MLILLVMLISLPAMITGMLDRAWPRALLYFLFLVACLSPWGRRQIAPVRELLSQQRRQLLVAARGKVIPNFDFVHQAVSMIVLIVILVTTAAAIKAYASGAWPRGTLFVLIALACFSAPGRLLMAPVVTPISEFVQRYRWQALLLLGLIATYRMSDTVMGVMANVFYIDQGFSKEQIASVSKLFGLIMTLLGAGAGGLLIVRFGILPILFIGGAASAATNLMFVVLSDMGPHLDMLILTISCDNFSAGLATSAFVAYLSSLTNLKFSATQYALLSSIMLLLPRLIGGYSGVMVESLGYHQFFQLTALLGVPTLILIAVQWGQERRQPDSSTPPTTEADTPPRPSPRCSRAVGTAVALSTDMKRPAFAGLLIASPCAGDHLHHARRLGELDARLVQLVAHRLVEHEDHAPVVGVGGPHAQRQVDRGVPNAETTTTGAGSLCTRGSSASLSSTSRALARSLA